MDTQTETKRVYTYEEIKQMYNETVEEYNTLQEDHSLLERALQDIARLHQKSIKVFKSLMQGPLPPDAASVVADIEKSLSCIKMRHDEEKIEAAYDALFIQERDELERIREQRNIYNQQLESVMRDQDRLAAKYSKTKALYEDTRSYKKNLDVMLKAKEEEFLTCKKKLAEDAKKVADLQEAIITLGKESKTIQDLIQEQTRHYHELKGNVQVELNKMVHYKAENKAMQERRKMQDCVQGNQIQDLAGEASAQTPPEKRYTRDAIGREVIVDGLIRMQIASNPPARKTEAVPELDPQTVEEIYNKLLYIEEIIAQTENVLQTLMSYADLD
tara:strand:- start:11814 stop:12803 length:990 start_codon:yes stop_codon:yes gene_type:complete